MLFLRYIFSTKSQHRRKYVLWSVIPYSLLEIFKLFGEAYHLHLQGWQMYQTAWHYVSEDMWESHFSHEHEWAAKHRNAVFALWCFLFHSVVNLFTMAVTTIVPVCLKNKNLLFHLKPVVLLIVNLITQVYIVSVRATWCLYATLLLHLHICNNAFMCFQGPTEYLCS